MKQNVQNTAIDCQSLAIEFLEVGKQRKQNTCKIGICWVYGYWDIVSVLCTVVAQWQYELWREMWNLTVALYTDSIPTSVLTSPKINMVECGHLYKSNIKAN